MTKYVYNVLVFDIVIYGQHIYIGIIILRGNVKATAKCQKINQMAFLNINCIYKQLHILSSLYFVSIHLGTLFWRGNTKVTTKMSQD